MLTLKQGIKLSAIADKLDLKIKIAKVEDDEKVELTQKELGADLLIQIVNKAHRAESEIIAFVAEMKKCSTEEAESIDLIAFVKEIASDSGIKDFFKSAVT